MIKERLYIFDTTLRDGAQTQGVDFSIDDKEKNIFISACNFIGILNQTKEEWLNFKKKKSLISEKDILKKIELRNKARENKDYKDADKIREELLDKGVLIEDKDGKTSWKIK